MTEEIQFIPDRLNEEPVIFLSMTNSEIKLAVIASLAGWTPICLIIGLVLGNVLMSIAGIMAMTFITMFLAGRKLRVLKRNKPKQYHVMAITAWLEDRNMKIKTMIRTSQVWDIRRSKGAQK